MSSVFSMSLIVCNVRTEREGKKNIVQITTSAELMIRMILCTKMLLKLKTRKDRFK